MKEINFSLVDLNAPGISSDFDRIEILRYSQTDAGLARLKVTGVRGLSNEPLR
jgi:hypothetical protein